jgi:hypothetical protein
MLVDDPAEEGHEAMLLQSSSQLRITVDRVAVPAQ